MFQRTAQFSTYESSWGGGGVNVRGRVTVKWGTGGIMLNGAVGRVSLQSDRNGCSL